MLKEREKGIHNLKEVWPSLNSIMHLEKLFCFDDPIGQNRIHSFATVIYYSSPIIFNRLSLFKRYWPEKVRGKIQARAFNESLVVF